MQLFLEIMEVMIWEYFIFASLRRAAADVENASHGTSEDNSGLRITG